MTATETMTEAEVLDAVRTLLAEAAIAPPIGGDSRHPLGQDNAERLLAALHGAGYAVVPNPSAAQWLQQLRATGRTVLDDPAPATDDQR